MSSKQAAIANEVWISLKDLIEPELHDRAADLLVSCLLDNDVHLDDIKYHFKNDNDIKTVVKYYSDDYDDFESEDADSDDE